jgi:hypothetical protein
MSATVSAHWRGWTDPEPDEALTLRPLVAEPLFGIHPFVPGGKCPHKRPIRRGSVFVCMQCHQYGRDYDPRLVIHPGDMPPPEASESAARSEPRAAQPKPQKLNRRERRAKQFGHKLPEKPCGHAVASESPATDSPASC